MAYGNKHGRVTFGDAIVMGADANTFEVLLAAWGRDREGIYYEGRKVPRADAKGFVALSPTVGIDSKSIYYRLVEHAEILRGPRPRGLEPADLVVISHEGLTFAKTPERVWVLTSSGPIALTGADPSSFVLLGRGYAKDRAHAYWFDREGIPHEMASANPATFVVDEHGAKDDSGRFLNEQRDTGPLAVELDPDPVAAIERTTRILWKRMLGRYWPAFDGTLPQDHDSFVHRTRPGTPTPIVSHALRYEGGWLVLRAGGLEYRGQPSALELMAAWLWGLARGKTTKDSLCLRVIPGLDRFIAEDECVPPSWELCLDLAYLFEKVGQHGEARLLIDRVFGESSHENHTEEVAHKARTRAQKLLGPVALSLPTKTAPKGSTTHAAMESLLLLGLHRDTDPIIRRNAAEAIGALVDATTEALSHFASVCEPALVLLDDPEPAVTAKAACVFEQLCAKLFSRRDYECALYLANALGKKGFNADLESARAWECLAALGRDQEAEEAWEMLNTLTERNERAPRHHAGIHVDYPSYELWRAFAELRVASAHLWAADGKHPSEELRDKRQPLMAAKLSSDTWEQRALMRLEAAQKTMERWIREAPAHKIAHLVAEFFEELARVSGVGMVSGMPFVMQKQYVDYRRFGIPYRFDGGRIERAGIFEEVAPRYFAFAEPDTRIRAAVGRVFGIEFRFDGSPIGRVLPASIAVMGPDGALGRAARSSTTVTLGLRESFVWKFETEEELVCGPWYIDVELFDARPPTKYPVRRPPEPTELIGHLRQDFTVVVDAESSA